MNGIHDLGGMHGFGAVQRGPDAPVFHARWQGRVHAMIGLVLGAGITTVDAFRHGIERIDPVGYLTAGYYGRWLRSLERICVEAGVVGADELARRSRALARGDAFEPAAPWQPPADPARPSGSYRRELDAAPRFRAGDGVRARNLNPAGHTRLPRYVRARRGTVLRALGAFVFPDTNAHGGGEQPQHLYTVRFEAEELWGHGAEGPGAVHLDLFESYLEPA